MSTTRKLATSAIASFSLALAACGGQDASGEQATVKVGTLPIMPTAAMYIGIEQGIFAKHHLDVQIETGQGGAALVPAVMSGTMDFATGNPTSLLTARDRGMDVRVITSYTYDTPDGVHAVLAKTDSGIESMKDLQGRTVAINTLKSMGDLHIMDAVEKAGGDPKKVQFVEMGFPQMEAALKAGQVDAVWTPEPFLTIIRDAGYEVVGFPGVESVKGHPTMMFFTSGSTIDKKPDMVANMQAAMDEAMDYASEHPDELRTVAAEKLKMDPALAKKVVLEEFGGPVRRDTVEQTGALMVKYGFIQKEADVDGLLQSAAKKE